MRLATDALNFVREVPAFAGAVLGFTGVILTLIVNAYLSRRQEHRREARALRIALIEELRIQKESLENSAQPTGDAGDATHTAVPLYRYEDVFTSVTANLGVLSGSEVAAVFQAYLPLRSLTWKLKLVEQMRTAGRPASDHHVWLPISDLDMVLAMHANHIPAIDEAIAELKRHL